MMYRGGARRSAVYRGLDIPAWRYCRKKSARRIPIRVDSGVLRDAREV